MKTELIKFETPELLAIEKSKAKQIKDTFEPMVQMLETFEGIYNEIMLEAEKGITKELCAKAKRARLDIGKVRILTDKERLAGNSESQREIKARNGVAHVVTWAVSDRETKLKELETHFETQEKLRLEKLQKERADELSKYVDDADERRLAEMEDDVWNAYLSAKKKEHEDRIEAEKQAELDRIAREKAEAEAIEQQRIENERLKAEAKKRENEEKEKQLLIQKRQKELQPYIVFIRDYNGLISKTEPEYKKEFSEIKKGAEDHWEYERKQKVEAERLAKIEAERLAKIEAEQAKIKEVFDARLKKEQEAKAKLEAEIKAKKDAEIKAENERKQAELKAKAEAERLAKAPIKNQLNAWVDSFEIQIPEHLKQNEKANEILTKFWNFKKWAKNEIESI